jgi:hypothetical protein
VQINDDGTHAILLVATRLTVRLDHVGVPVMGLRLTDGKMRRDGFLLPCRRSLAGSATAEQSRQLAIFGASASRPRGPVPVCGERRGLGAVASAAVTPRA